MNTVDYWSSRFRSDWESRGGREQSRFFYQIALDIMPQWLLRAIRGEGLRICDWGCALGDGADLLAQVLEAPVTGVDFSPVAVEMARTRYQKPSFLAADFLMDEGGDSYDVLFSSNTLEHFEHPWQVAETLLRRTKAALVLLVPYREYDRIDEHQSFFEHRNIPSTLGASFQLIHARVVDAGAYQPTYWGGNQVLLVYSTQEFARAHNVTLADMDISPDMSVVDNLTTRLEKANTELLALAAIKDAHEQQSLYFSRVASERDETISHLTSEKDRLMGEIAHFKEEADHLREEMAHLSSAIRRSKCYRLTMLIKGIWNRLSNSSPSVGL